MTGETAKNDPAEPVRNGPILQATFAAPFSADFTHVRGYSFVP